MDEATKTKQIWGELERSVIRGKGIDIGCGPDPVTPDVRRFDIEDGDANEITKYVSDQFDYVYSSHCLEHMKDPFSALNEWWKLVRPGGHLVFLVPDEDLYEQGVFPSRFNGDHKSTFTISKAQSWSPVSVNVFDLARSLPDSAIIDIRLQDTGYDRAKLRHGPRKHPTGLARLLRRIVLKCTRYSITIRTAFSDLVDQSCATDQTSAGALAQIQCIIKKVQR